LTHELAYYRRIRFGKASEMLVGEQRQLFEETVDIDLAAIEEELDGEAPAKRKRTRAGRQALPPELARIEHRHEPESCRCGQCGADLVKIGEDNSEQLDVEPARFFVHRHIRPQYACRPCETVTAVPIPPTITDGGMAAVGLLAWIAACKYLDHLPLYQIAARQGVPLARSTLAGWIGRIGVALQPLADRLAELLWQQACLHADETPVRQLDPGSGKTKHAYLWVYRSGVHDAGPPIVVFDYQTRRAGAHARAFLHGWRGHLMVDDYVGYKAMFTDGPTELACLAHIRRKFFDVHAASGSPVAEEALRRIAALYLIEQQGAGPDPSQRLAPREQLAMPALAELRVWLLATQRTVAAGSGTAKAVDHALKRWPALERYAGSGKLPIGRVEMWRGGCELTPAAPFPHSPRRTGRADFPHPALFRRIKPSRSSGRVQATAGVSDPISRRGTGRNTGGTPFPACRCAFAARFANAVPYSHQFGGKFSLPALD
jgi:transposase